MAKVSCYLAPELLGAPLLAPALHRAPLLAPALHGARLHHHPNWCSALDLLRRVKEEAQAPLRAQSTLDLRTQLQQHGK